MTNLIFELPTDDNGIQDASIDLSGTTLRIMFTYWNKEKLLSGTISFYSVISFMWINELGAISKNDYDRVISVDRLDIIGDTIKEFDEATLKVTPRSYRAFLSNFGGIEVLASDAEMKLGI